MAGIPTIEVDLTSDQDPIEVDVPSTDDDTAIAVDVPSQVDDTRKPSTVRASLAGALQGVTMEFGDEIVAGVESLVKGTSYRAAQKKHEAEFERLREAHPVAFTAAEIGAGLLTAFTPAGIARAGAAAVVKTGAKEIGKAALKGVGTGVVFGGVAGAGASKATVDQPLELLEDITKGAVLGGALGGALTATVKTAQTLSRNARTARAVATVGIEGVRAGEPLEYGTMKAVAELVDDNSAQVVTAADRHLNRIPSFAPEVAKDNPAFVRWYLHMPPDAEITRDTATQFYRQWATLRGAAQAGTINQYRRSQATMSAVADVVEKQGQDITGQADPFKNRALRYFQDPMFKSKDIDAVYGTNVEGTIAGISDSTNRMSVHMAPYLKRLAILDKATRQHFQGPEGRALVKEALEGGKIQLSTEQTAVVQGWRELLAHARGQLRQLGLSIEELPNYFPHKMADRGDLHARLTQRWSQLRGPKFRPSDDEGFMEAVSTLRGGVNAQTPADITKAIDSLLSTEFHKTSLGQVASAAFGRGEGLPEILRQQDIAKAAMQYLTTGFKTAYLRRAYHDLHTNVTALRAFGAENSARWLDRYMRRMSNEPSTASAYLQAAGAHWKSHWTRAVDNPETGKFMRTLGETAKAVPDFMSWTTSQIYPNLLGWNISKPVRNLSQTLLLTVPELGHGYGYSVAMKGVARSMKTRQSGATMLEFLQQRGLAGDQYAGETARLAVEDGLSRIPGLQSVNKWSQLGMSLYQWTDTVNRFYTYHMGVQVADDIMKGVPKAVRWLNRMSSGDKQVIRKALRSGDEDLVNKTVAGYLIRKTQFNYGKAGLSDFGQDFGRLVSMFTKWTVMVGSDVADMVKHRQGLDKVAAPMMKYVAPLTVLMASDAALREMDLSDNPIKKALIGKSLTSMSPMNSLFNVGAPPVVAAPAKLGKAVDKALEGELREGGRLMWEAVYPFLPVIGAGPNIYKTGTQLSGQDDRP